MDDFALSPQNSIVIKLARCPSCVSCRSKLGVEGDGFGGDGFGVMGLGLRHVENGVCLTSKLPLGIRKVLCLT